MEARGQRKSQVGARDRVCCRFHGSTWGTGLFVEQVDGELGGNVQEMAFFFVVLEDEYFQVRPLSKGEETPKEKRTTLKRVASINVERRGDSMEAVEL